MSQILVGKTGDYKLYQYAWASEASEPLGIRNNMFSWSLLRLVWTAARPVATIVYIALIIFDRIECFYSFIN